jgi:hypothetical protein
MPTPDNNRREQIAREMFLRMFRDIDLIDVIKIPGSLATILVYCGTEAQLLQAGLIKPEMVPAGGEPQYKLREGKLNVITAKRDADKLEVWVRLDGEPRLPVLAPFCSVVAARTFAAGELSSWISGYVDIALSGIFPLAEHYLMEIGFRFSAEDSARLTALASEFRAQAHTALLKCRPEPIAGPDLRAISKE